MSGGDKDPAEHPKAKQKLHPALEANIWKKGQSGNPAGRPKGSGSLLKALQDKLDANDGAEAKALVERMFAIVENDESLAVKLFKDFVDRTAGRATEHKEITIKDTTKLVVLEDEGDEGDEEESDNGSCDD